MSPQRARARAFSTLILTIGLVAACADDPSNPTPQSSAPRFSAASENGALIEVGQYGVPFGLVVSDAANRLLLLYRFNNGFCGGTAATDFVQATFKDVIRMNESWRTVDKAEDLWFYVYPWNGTTFPSCAFLRNTTPLATGRGSRMITDNDFFPFAPYEPGPGANAYSERYHGALTTPASETVQFLGQLHVTVAPDGNTIRQLHSQLQLSSNPN